MVPGNPGDCWWALFGNRAAEHSSFLLSLLRRHVLFAQFLEALQAIFCTSMPIGPSSRQMALSRPGLVGTAEKTTTNDALSTAPAIAPIVLPEIGPTYFEPSSSRQTSSLVGYKRCCLKSPLSAVASTMISHSRARDLFSSAQIICPAGARQKFIARRGEWADKGAGHN